MQVFNYELRYRVYTNCKPMYQLPTPTSLTFINCSSSWHNNYVYCDVAKTDDYQSFHCCFCREWNSKSNWN